MKLLCRSLSTISRYIMNESVEFSSERNVGIINFVNDCAGFKGILKQRYNDFVVREIDTAGTICGLKSISGTEVDAVWFANNTTEATDVDQFISSLLNMKVTLKASSEEIKDFIELCCDRASECGSYLLLCDCSSKEQRTSVHQLVKTSFSAFVDSDTQTAGEVSTIRLIARHKRTKEDKSQLRKVWPKDLGIYLHFTMAKENVDTLSAVNILSKNLMMKAENIGYAGTKDKRAITYQKCSVHKRKASDVCKLNNINRLPYIRCGDFEYKNQPIVLGQLQGNHFDITLRNVSVKYNENSTENFEDTLKAACEAMLQNGFINYFGLQRFGKGVTPTHKIGLEIIKSDWQACVESFFVPKIVVDTTSTSKELLQTRTDISNLQRLFENQNYEAALKACDGNMHSEVRLLESLVRFPSDYYRAFHCISRNIRILCVHAYQSYLWNIVCSRRMSVSKSCIVGDLVLVEGGESIDSVGDTIDEKSDAGGVDLSSVVVHEVTEEDISTEKYTIFDVIVPILGTDVQISSVFRTLYTELLEADGLTIDSFSQCLKPYQTKGLYRRIIQKPKDFEYKIIPYSAPDEDLFSTELPTFLPNKPISEDVKDKSGVVDASATAKYTALYLGFSLPPGTYATMMLRELMKQSTETLFHAEQTKVVAENSKVAEANDK